VIDSFIHADMDYLFIGNLIAAKPDDAAILVNWN